MDPSDGYAYALTRLEGEEAEFLLERQSVGLPGLGGVVSPPGTWEPRQVITVKPAVWDTLKGRCTYRCVAPELLATPPPAPVVALPKVTRACTCTRPHAALDIVLDSPTSFFNPASGPEVHRVVVSAKDDRFQYLFLNRWVGEPTW